MSAFRSDDAPLWELWHAVASSTLLRGLHPRLLDEAFITVHRKLHT
eukprot:COSAG03_NODE_16883_length_389_cov_2.137931_1_plen_45_part_10